MHLDGVGHRLEVQRAQMIHAIDEKGVLLAHDFRRDLHDRPGALIEATGQPMCRLHALSQKILILACTCLMFRHLGEITLVDEHARQGLGIDFHQPAAGGGGTNDNVGNDGLRNHRIVTRAGAGIERADFRQHVEEVFLIDATDFFQGGKVAFRQKFQIVDESPHGRVEPVLLGKLDCQTFA